MLCYQFCERKPQVSHSKIVMAAPRTHTKVQVMFFDTDCGGVVSNIAYLRFVETARTHLADKLGLRVAEMADKQTYPVVVRTEIDYRHSAKLADELVIEGSLHRVERARFWCAFRITRPKDKTLIADCRQMLALIELPSGKLLRLPDSWEKYREQPRTNRGTDQNRIRISGEGSIQ